MSQFQEEATNATNAHPNPALLVTLSSWMESKLTDVSIQHRSTFPHARHTNSQAKFTHAQPAALDTK